MGKNWLASVLALNTGARIQIVALDAATRDAFAAEFILYRPRTSTELTALWQFRIEIMREILATGESIIHSDADAIWVQNPLPMIQAMAADMVFSQGTVWPPDVHARHGIVLCCGFFYLSHATPVLDFMADVAARIVTEKDDQLCMNRILSERGVAWDVKDGCQISFKNKTFTVSREAITSQSGFAPSVAILPHHAFPRLLDHVDKDVIVAHPFSPKTCAGKIDVLSELSLWSLP